ncbi:MAG: ornithine carbamoyltransferase [Gammaproteobacteria bacterium]|nr:MAG: ornithine carbamoyltransferase [Gammaproteobacteria bacterium]
MTVNETRHFLSLLDFSPEELGSVVDRGIELKRLHHEGVLYEPLKNRTLAMIFQLSSTRTRVAFEAGMQQLGGHAIFLSPDDTQLGRGEPIEDTARVLSGMVDVVMIRTTKHADIEAFAAASSVPVINAMSSRFHPCQLLADVQTFVERRGEIAGREVAFIGDGYNMCNSYINAARQFGFNLRIASPEGFQPDPQLVASSNNVQLVDSPAEAARDADLVVTDVWSSMGHEQEQARRREAFSGYQVDAAMLDLANDDALLMHCLPAHRGQEVSETIMDDPRSAIWQEAGNRLHSQKALLEFLLLTASV